MPAVNGSSWVTDPTAGWCVLTSCPPGYELINTAVGGGAFIYSLQHCSVCPPSSYCPGGTSSSQTCPAGTFAPAGSNAAGSCKAAVFLAIVVELPLQPAAFDSMRREAFRNAVAYACGADTASVIVADSGEVRRAADGSLQVGAQIAAKDAVMAATLEASLKQDTLNSRLKEQGLPAGTLVSVAVVSTGSPTSVSIGPSWAAIGGGMAGFAVAVILASAAFAWFVLRRKISEEELLLNRTISELRERLKIRLRDGFALSSESAGSSVVWRPWRRGSSPASEHTIISRSYVEAAARLALFHDFDVNYLDAFCLCLECACTSTSLPTRSGPVTPIEAACDWILEVRNSAVQLYCPSMLSFPSQKQITEKR